MKKSVYLRGTTARYWYNFTELLAMAILKRPVPEEVTMTKRVKYGSGKAQYINIFSQKKSQQEKRPLFLYIHGGGWISGVTDMRNTYVSQWAKLGFFCASVSYTYAPEKIFPTQLHEIFAAIDFLFDRADEYGIDTDNIIIAGESAGGYYISYVSACCGDKNLYDKLGISFRHRDEFKVKAMISISGCHSLHRLADSIKPQSKFPDIKMMISSFAGLPYKEMADFLKTEKGKLFSPPVNKNYPPAFIVWGDKDYLRYEAFDFSQELKALGVSHELYKADGIIGMHAWAIATIVQKGRDCLLSAFDFALPYLPDCFEKQNGQWKIKRQTEVDKTHHE